jgi:hypothetical protein
MAGVAVGAPHTLPCLARPGSTAAMAPVRLPTDKQHFFPQQHPSPQFKHSCQFASNLWLAIPTRDHPSPYATPPAVLHEQRPRTHGCAKGAELPSVLRKSCCDAWCPGGPPTEYALLDGSPATDMKVVLPSIGTSPLPLRCQ